MQLSTCCVVFHRACYYLQCKCLCENTVRERPRVRLHEIDNWYHIIHGRLFQLNILSKVNLNWKIFCNESIAPNIIQLNNILKEYSSTLKTHYTVYCHFKYCYCNVNLYCFVHTHVCTVHDFYPPIHHHNPTITCRNHFV